MTDYKCDEEYNGYCKLKAGLCDVEQPWRCPYKERQLIRERKLIPRQVHDRATINNIDLGLVPKVFHVVMSEMRCADD